MSEKLGFLVCLTTWFAVHKFCMASFVMEKNCLKVTLPDNLRATYECAIGNFGIPEYAGTLIGAVIFPRTNQMACKSFDAEIFGLKPAGGLPIVLLANRGGCYLTLKAWNAQKAGAAGILIADDRVEPINVMDTPEEQGADALAEYLQNITIPSALISKYLGDSIKKAALSNRDVVTINLDWSVLL